MLRRGRLLLMIAMTLIALTLVLAFANGANDVSKGVATLVGSGLTSYRRAVLWGSSWTVLGAVAAGFGSQILLETFSGRGILVQPEVSAPFLLAVASGAVGWLILATGTGMPVSTTHSLAGALVGAALLQTRLDGIVWPGLLTRIVIPLLISPLLAVALLLVVRPFLRPLLARADRYCICVEDLQPSMAGGASFHGRRLTAVGGGRRESCSSAAGRITAVDGLHWMSSGATSFFRGLNDTPKVLAVGVAAAMGAGLSLLPMYFVVALAMGAGSFVAGLRVTRTLAEKVAPINATNGFGANLVTSLLVGAASIFGLPVSTTHVSSGAVIGAGLSGGSSTVHWPKITEMLVAWVVTLPSSALLAALALIIID